ncbi:hypothetical protein ACFLWN_01895 [Chloroflexota bacterium]
MKRKLVIFITALFLALTVSVGTYAYTFHIATATFDVTAAGGDIVTRETAPSESQPDWNEVLPEIEYDQEMLIPDGPGCLTRIQSQYPDTGAHWDKVDDMPPDDEETYVAWRQGNFRTDLYSVSDHMDGEGEIIGVNVNFRFAGSEDGGAHSAFAKAVISSHDGVFQGSEETTIGSGFVTRSYQWEYNPATGEAWTWDEIDQLQAGISLKGGNPHREAYCTAVWVIVDYELPPIIEGEVPPGNLFTITPHPDYTGDLLVNIYLTNTGLLKLCYQHLNLKVYLENSLEAAEDPEYQVLSLENGVASFNIEGGSDTSYIVQVVGGGYNLISGDPYEWGEGWTHIPELYCEVTQR